MKCTESDDSVQDQHNFAQGPILTVVAYLISGYFGGEIIIKGNYLGNKTDMELFTSLLSERNQILFFKRSSHFRKELNSKKKKISFFKSCFPLKLGDESPFTSSFYLDTNIVRQTCSL